MNASNKTPTSCEGSSQPAQRNSPDPLQAQDAAPVGPTTEDQFRRLAILNAFMVELDSRLRMGESHGDGKVSTKMLRDLLDNLFKAAPAAGVQGDAARLDWLEQSDDRFYNIDKITAVKGAGFNGFFSLRAAIDAAIASQGLKGVE